MKKILLIALALMLSSVCWGQAPRPFVAGGGILLGSGYVPAGVMAVGGVNFDAKNFHLNPEVAYETGGKDEDNANTSSSGHTRYAKSDVLFRVGKWFIGPGASWSKLYTPAYDKSSVHPRITAEKDFDGVYFDKMLFSYVQRGTDVQNGINGIETQAYWFFGQKHFFLRMDLGAYWGHATVVPVSAGNSPQTVSQELSEKLTSGTFQTVVGWRF